MEDSQSGRDPAFTQKEMLVRIDAKVDVIAAKQAHQDVELALLRARQDALETAARKANDGEDDWRDEVRADVAAVKQQQADISNRQKATAIVVAAIVTVSTILTPIVLRLIG